MTASGRAGVAARLYGLALRLYPVAFREEQGADLVFAFEDRVGAARASAGLAHAYAVAARELWDLLRNAPGAWAESSASATRRRNWTVALAEGAGDWMRDIRQGARSLAKRPALAAAAVLTMGLAVSGKAVDDPLMTAGGPIVGQHQMVQVLVAGVLRQRLAEIEKIPVEVDIVFVDPTQPGKSMRVQRMHQNDADIVRQRAVFPGAKPADKGAGAAETFGAVNAAGTEHHSVRIRVADQGDVDIEIAAVRAF